MGRKGLFALVGVLVATLIGAYASLMTTTGGFNLSNVANTGSFVIYADKIVVSGGPPSTQMSLETFEGIPVVSIYNAKVEITNLCQRIFDENITLEINATKAVGTGVTVKVTKMTASATEPATFTDLEMTDIDTFLMTMGGNVTLTGVEIHGVYLFAETMTLYGMEITIF